MEKKTSKQVLTMTYTLEEKKFFVVATFEGMWVDSFQTVKKCSILGLYDSSLDFQRR